MALKSQIVQSPDRIRREITDNTLRLEREQKEASNAERKAGELVSKAEFIEQSNMVCNICVTF